MDLPTQKPSVSFRPTRETGKITTYPDQHKMCYGQRCLTRCEERRHCDSEVLVGRFEPLTRDVLVILGCVRALVQDVAERVGDVERGA